MANLYTENFVGEFGWELFCWQGYIRRLSKRYDHTVVMCRHGHEILYQDFADTVSEDVLSEHCDMWQCKGYKRRPFEELFRTRLRPKDRFIRTDQPHLRYDHTHKLNSQPLFARFKEQDFVKYGDKREGGYDVLIHARNKSNKVNAGRNSDYRNWKPENWDLLAEKLKGLRVGCIGTKKSAICPLGDDVRGVNLKWLSNIMASSKALISPSSGPVHFSALCGCPTITWWGDPYGPENAIRYLRDWNPFNTPVSLKFVSDWQVPVDWIVESLEQYLD